MRLTYNFKLPRGLVLVLVLVLVVVLVLDSRGRGRGRGRKTTRIFIPSYPLVSSRRSRAAGFQLFSFQLFRKSAAPGDAADGPLSRAGFPARSAPQKRRPSHNHPSSVTTHGPRPLLLLLPTAHSRPPLALFHELHDPLHQSTPAAGSETSATHYPFAKIPPPYANPSCNRRVFNTIQHEACLDILHMGLYLTPVPYPRILNGFCRT
jgi:hypothetical protein